jgi:hypothetical protein
LKILSKYDQAQYKNHSRSSTVLDVGKTGSADMYNNKAAFTGNSLKPKPEKKHHTRNPQPTFNREKTKLNLKPEKPSAERKWVCTTYICADFHV